MLMSLPKIVDLRKGFSTTRLLANQLFTEQRRKTGMLIIETSVIDLKILGFSPTDHPKYDVIGLNELQFHLTDSHSEHSLLS